MAVRSEISRPATSAGPLYTYGDFNDNDYARGNEDEVVEGIANCLRAKGENANEKRIGYSNEDERVF